MATAREVKEKNKKPRGMNILDALCILLIVILAFGVYARFIRGAEKTDAKETEYFYTILIKGLKQKAVDNIERSKNLQFQLDSKTPDDMGELISIVMTSNENEITKTDGTIITAPYPERYNVQLTFRVKGSITNEGFFTRNLNRINTGSWYVIRSKWTAVYGNVTNVWE